MKNILIPVILLLPVLTSCVSNDQFEERIDRRSEALENVQDRRKIRIDARQDRTDAWYDRAMNTTD